MHVNSSAFVCGPVLQNQIYGQAVARGDQQSRRLHLFDQPRLEGGIGFEDTEAYYLDKVSMRHQS